VNWVILRGFLVDGKPDTSAAMFRRGLEVYPLARRADRPAMQFTNASGRPFNTIHANDFEFYEELHTVIDREPIGLLDPELRGLFASVGIQKGVPFEPTDREKRILTDAVAIGNGTARAIAFRPRLDGADIYPDSGWKTAFVGGSYEWLRDGGDGGRNLDARTFFYYIATVNTPAMILKMVGRGSQYGLVTTDANGDYLDGSRNYTLTIPANVPAKDFWSAVVYDPQTRSELQTDQPFPSRNSKKDPLAVNADGSVDLYFGPRPPAGKASNWIQTVPCKGWFALLRLYGPLEPWFDKTWRPGEIEPVRWAATADSCRSSAGSERTHGLEGPHGTPRPRRRRRRRNAGPADHAADSRRAVPGRPWMPRRHRWRRRDQRGRSADPAGRVGAVPVSRPGG